MTMRVAGIVPDSKRTEVEFIRSMLVLGDWVRTLAEQGALGGKILGPRPMPRRLVRAAAQAAR